MSGFELQRIGMIMEPEPGNPREVEGVLNPGAVRGPDGNLYLFPRMVAKGNFSRIGIARVRFNGWSPRRSMSCGPAAADARTRASPTSNRSSATS
jgi:hypothetical protein